MGSATDAKRRWARKNPDKLKEYKDDYYKKNRDRISKGNTLRKERRKETFHDIKQGDGSKSPCDYIRKKAPKLLDDPDSLLHDCIFVNELFGK